MRDWKLTKWCSIAAKKIRYTPDREAVFKELRQHLDERSDSFLAKGMTEAEAVKKTLEVMGSPDELSIMLGQIHRPYWGYAYSITKVLANVMVIAALVLTVLNVALSLIKQDFSQPYYSNYHPPYTDTESESFSRVGLWEQSNSYSFGGYTYQVEKSALWDNKSEGNDLLCAQIRIVNYLPWAATPEIGEHLEAVDNLGNHYVNTWYNHNRQPHTFRRNQVVHTTTFVWLLEIDIRSPDFTGVEWIEIRSMDNREFALRIDLSGGGTQ